MTCAEALQSAVPSQPLLSRNIWQQFDLIREFEIVFCLVATLFTVLCELIRFFFDRGARNARSLFMISNLYLMTVMLLLVVNA